MNKRFIAALALCLVPFACSGCLDEKVLDVVILGETSADFSQNETTVNWTEDAVIDVAQQIRDILEDNDYELDDLKDAHVTSASYGVTSFPPSFHDWFISGQIQVSRDGGTFVTLTNYYSQSVEAALGWKISAPLEQPGVDLINAALQDFLAGADPVLVFRINNADTLPAPTVQIPMIFDWRAWLAIQVIVDQTLEVPDPF